MGGKTFKLRSEILRAEGKVKGRAEGRAEGKTEGFEEKGIQVFLNCLGRNMSIEDAQAIAEISDELVERALKMRK